MNNLWKALLLEAKDKITKNLSVTLSFSDKYQAAEIWTSIELASQYGTDVSSKKNLCQVMIHDSFVIKSDRRNMKRRFKESFLNLDNKLKGHQGLFGEAYNTLIANRRGMPSHRILGISFHYSSCRAVIVYERLMIPSLNQLILDNPQDINSYLLRSFDFFKKSLSYGIFHGDVNVNNIFMCSDSFTGVLIDFELVLALNCDLKKALVLQIATMRNQLLRSLISDADFKELALSYIVVNDEDRELLTLFETYYKEKLSRKERHSKLNIILGVKASPLLLSK